METSVSMEHQAVVTATKAKKGLRALNKEQWMSLVSLAVGNMGIATCSSLQAPFFPQEAERKGATPSQYGLVFGLFYLTVFIFSPIFGKIMNVVSPEFMRDTGMFVVGVCFILFGFLDESPAGTTFIALAYVIRIVEGIGSAAFKTSNFALVAAYFPADTMATALGVLETTFGLGLIIGPSLGSALYEWGGFELPFICSGIFLLLVTVFSFFSLKRKEHKPPSKKAARLSVWKFIKNPLVIIYVSMLILAPICLGFNLATLEPHVRQFNLSPMMVGLLFVISGGIYGFASSVFGFLCDKGISPKILSFYSCLSLGVCYTFIGPAPIFTFDTKLWLVIVCLVLFGTGFGGTRVIAYVDCLNEAVAAGQPNDLSTSGVISGTFSSALAIGFFIGPTIGGIFLETIGYNMGSAILAVLMYSQTLAFLIYMIVMKCKKLKTPKSRLDDIKVEYAPVVEDSPLVSDSAVPTTSYGTKNEN